MKVLREYSFSKGLLNCVCSTLPVQDSEFGEKFLQTEDIEIVFLSAMVEPPAPGVKKCMLLRAQCDAGRASIGFAIDEMSRFISTLKQMYEL